MTRVEWMERALVLMKKLDRVSGLDRLGWQELEALLAEPAEPAYKAGEEIPWWYAARLASEGLAAEVEWDRPGPDIVLQWTRLDEDQPHWEAVFRSPELYRFRLRPAPTQPEPVYMTASHLKFTQDETAQISRRIAERLQSLGIEPEPAPREAFEEAMAAYDAVAPGDPTLHWSRHLERALRALADDHARRALDTAERYDRLVEKYRLLAEEVAALRRLVTPLEGR